MSGNNVIGNSGNNGNDKENSKSEGTDDAGYGNATNAEEYNSQNQNGILFPIAEEVSRTETDLIAMIKTTGKEKDYELIEYVLDINTRYTQVLMELNENGAMDAVYTYGVSRLTEDRFTGESNFYLYDPAGYVAGITDQDGYLWQSYRYDAFGNATFGSPQYDNEYMFNAESYNPNIHSQYLRARYYDTVKGSFLTEDSYLGDIRNPLTLNRYSYCIGNPLFYRDPSGHESWQDVASDYLKDCDTYGISIGMHYLYGGGEDMIVNEKSCGPWTKYMEKNTILTGKVGDMVIPIGDNLKNNESIEIDISFSMIIQNGEGARGYMFMHGTDSSVGGFQMKGTISKDKKGTRTYDLVYTWNDIMNPFPEVYTTDEKSRNSETISLC